MSRRQVLQVGAGLAALPLLAGLTTDAQAQQAHIQQVEGANLMSMEISRNGTRPSTRGAAETFTGSVTVDPWYAPNTTTTSSGSLVSFAPGARSAWHTHPAGQVLIVQSGMGWVQEEGGEKIEVKPGDVIWTPPGVKHWHGAASTTAMSHIAITNAVDGRAVDWLEHVPDDQYLA